MTVTDRDDARLARQAHDAAAAAEQGSLWRTISVGLFAVLGLFLVAFGVLYATVQDMLWFHAAAVPEEVRHEVKPLYLALMKLIGGSSAALGLLGGYVTLGPLRRGAAWAATALAATYAIPVVMAAFVAETLAALTGAPTSWHIMGVLLAVTAAAYGAQVAGRRGAFWARIAGA